MLLSWAVPAGAAEPPRVHAVPTLAETGAYTPLPGGVTVLPPALFAWPALPVRYEWVVSCSALKGLAICRCRTKCVARADDCHCAD
jgi:hypothetical protein